MADPHGPHDLNNYLHVHQRYMDGWLADGFVLRDGCTITTADDQVRIAGTIYCLGGIELEVDKILAYVGRWRRKKVKTGYFTYHAQVKGIGNILRYESKGGHRDLPHKHTYDTLGDGEEISVIEYHKSEKIPVLDAVIKELRDWHNSHRTDLP